MRPFALLALPPLLALALAAACSSPSPATGSTGGGSAGTSSSSMTTTSGPPPPPDCRGTPIPPGDVKVEPDGRSMALKTGSFTLWITVIDDGILRLRYEDPSSPAPSRASYAVLPQEGPADPVTFGATADSVLVCTSALLLEARRDTGAMRVTAADGTLIVEDPEGGGYLHMPGTGEVSLRRPIAEGEHFYGLGEKTGALDRRGRRFTFYNTDAYQDAFGGYPPDADPLYTSVPFFIGLRKGSAYGLFLDNTFKTTFDLGEADASAYTLTAEGGAIDHYLIAGPEMERVVERYTRLTGRMPLPPRWALGYHQSRWGYLPDSKIVQVASELRNRKIPADAIWLDIQHMDGFRSFTWDPVAFPDPAGMVSDLDALGFSTVAIVDPAIKVDPGWDVYTEGLSKGYFLGQGGMPYVGKVWPGDAVFPDFSAPETRAYWGSLVPRTLGPGVRGLWIDMNEPSNFTGQPGGTVPDSLVCAGDGAAGTMAELHNVYALNEARATYEGMKAASPDTRPFILTRAGYAGIQRYAATWTGDAPSSWATLQTTLPMILGMGLSGMPFAGSDVGGYSGSPSPELFARWVLLGSISPFFRDHVATGTPDQEPWQFGFEVEDISRSAIGARYSLLPYLYSLFREASLTGAPVLRPLVYAFQTDEASAAVGDEAMLGPSLLVAPALAEGGMSRSVYLPPGRWFEAGSGAIVEGGQSIDVDLTLAALPMYAREGAIVPHTEVIQHTGEKPAGPLYFDLYPGQEASHFTLYEDDGTSFGYAQGAYSAITYTLARKGGTATFTASKREGSYQPPARPLLVRVRRVDHGATAVRLDGKSLAAVASYEALLAKGLGYYYDDRDLSLVVLLPDQPGLSLEMDYDPSIADPAPPVSMKFVVDLPPGTPKDKPITIATSANGWTHVPLAWGPSPSQASGLIPVPRGKWVYYKYARGDWSTVEKYPGCVEAKNRYAFGRANPVKEDTVWMWADLCP